MGPYGYDPYGQQPDPGQQGGHDEYGRSAHGQPQQPDPYRSVQDPYADPYPQQDGYGDPYARQEQWVPQPGPQAQPAPVADEWPPQEPAAQEGAAAPAGTAATASGEAPPGAVPRQRQEPQPEYSSEQFSFVEESTGDSEDVIDWLKFTESRTERREEAKRRGRNRFTALVVVLVFAAAGGVGWAWYAGGLPWAGGSGDTSQGASAAGQQRDVIAVHLHSTGDGTTSTALLVGNEEAGAGTTVLLPNSLAVSKEDGGATTLAGSVANEGPAPTREGLGRLLGADIKGTWRLDTPYLETLVEMSGGITVDTDTTVPAAEKDGEPQVEKGRGRVLDGREAVAYATYRAPGEAQTKQLGRFGEVLEQTLRKISTDPDSATRTVEALGQVLDPSLTESELGASLAELAEQARNGSYRTTVLPVRADGTLGRATSEGLVREVLGGTVRNSDPDGVLRVEVSDATGVGGRAASAEAALVNSGCTVVEGSSGTARAHSRVTYTDPGQKAKAEGVAKTLGLPASAVQRAGSGERTKSADVAVLLGRNYEG